MTFFLRKTLIDVKVSSCVNLDVDVTLRALEPIRDRIRRLHLDFIWKESDNHGHSFLNFDLNVSAEPNDYALMECLWVQIHVLG